LDIRYEDDDVVVLHKPAGMVVHPGVSNYTGTLVNALMHYIDNLPTRDENHRPGLVHRLDKNTSGLMVIAKNEYALAHLSKQFFDRTIERRYTALVWGDVLEDTGTINVNIGRHPRLKLQQMAFPNNDDGKHATTHFTVKERFGYTTLVECKLETGRTHQIRVHMKYIGHPVFNDDRYDGDKIVAGTVYSKYKQFVDNCFSLRPRHALHAQSLGFTHPVSGEWLYFEAPLPEDMAQVIEKWRRYSLTLKLDDKE
jgi:23S rRNA pseudouridine1911/1915/1917 synthase